MICEKIAELVIVRTISDFHKQLSENKFDFILLNIDDRLFETTYIKEISKKLTRNTTVIVFGQYDDQARALTHAGVKVFLNDPGKEDFEAALA